MVLLCLYGVGVKGVSWPVRYLDKPQGRAVYWKLKNCLQTGLELFQNQLFCNLKCNGLLCCIKIFNRTLLNDDYIKNSF